VPLVHHSPVTGLRWHVGGIRLPKEDEVSSASVSGSGASGKRPLVITLAVVGVLALVYGVLNLAVKGLPKALTLYSTSAKTNITHPLHGVVAIVVGVVLFAAAWWVNKKAVQG
jgi:hypothetical protein